VIWISGYITVWGVRFYKVFFKWKSLYASLKYNTGSNIKSNTPGSNNKKIFWIKKFALEKNVD